MLAEGREAFREAVTHRLRVGVIAGAEFDGDGRIATLPLPDCEAEMTEAPVPLADRPPSATLDALFDLGAAMATPLLWRNGGLGSARGERIARRSVRRRTVGGRSYVD